MMKIGVVVHGPYIIDSGHAEKILELLRDYGEVKARLGGTMGRTAVYDAELEDRIDISQKLLPSESIDKFIQDKYDVIFLMNYGKSSITGHAFGFKVFSKCKNNPPLIQIERPDEADGSVIAWVDSLSEFANIIAKRLNLEVADAWEIKAKMISNNITESCRKVTGVSPDENIFVNGIVVGKSTSSDVTLIAEEGIITEIIGGTLKEHGVEKLGKVNLKKAIIKTGLLRRSKVTPRVLKSSKKGDKFNIAFLNHAAEDIYKLKNVDMVVTVGDDTTLVAGDILYRFGVPIIGITDGDIDKVVEKGFKTDESWIIELESGWDDVIGEKIFFKLFNGEEIIEIENIESFKKEILQIINNTTTCYCIKENWGGQLDLNILIDSIKNFEGITRKNSIKDITNILKDTYNIAGNTILSFGDDASAIDIGNQKLALLAADGMWGKLMEADPRWAGYCSVLVNVNDIAAMGGIPIGMTNVISTPDEKIRREIMEGIKEGVEKFGVPMVGGHFHPDTPYNALDVSITGIVNKNDVITSCGANVGDKVIIAIDIDGELHPNFPLNWDTTTMKSKELVQAQIRIMNKIAGKNLVTSGRDISNPGTLGTLGMLLEASDVGAIIELEKIPRNENIEWEQWLKLYPGSGFVLTAKSEKVDKCIELLEDVNITSAVVGDITEDKKLYISHEGQKEILFDFKSDEIMGFKEEKSLN